MFWKFSFVNEIKMFSSDLINWLLLIFFLNICSTISQQVSWKENCKHMLGGSSLTIFDYWFFFVMITGGMRLPYVCFCKFFMLIFTRHVHPLFIKRSKNNCFIFVLHIPLTNVYTLWIRYAWNLLYNCCHTCDPYLSRRNSSLLSCFHP